MQANAQKIVLNYFDIGHTAYKNGFYQTAEVMYAAALSANNLGHTRAATYSSQLNQAAGLYGLACVYRQNGKLAESSKVLRRAFRLLCQMENGQVPFENIGRVACLLADTYLEEGKQTRALPVLKAAVGEICRRGGEDGVSLLPLVRRIALIYDSSRRPAQVDRYYRQAAKIEQANRQNGSFC